jgi:hypothetical protein
MGAADFARAKLLWPRIRPFVRESSKTVLACSAVCVMTALQLSSGCGQVAGSAPGGLVGGSPQLAQITLPEGFRIQVYAEKVDGARSMTSGPPGTLFVGTDHRADEVKVIAEGLTSPNGVAFRDGALYVAEQSRVIRFDNIVNAAAPAKPKVVNASFPNKDAHGWKFIAFGPDGLLYVPVGAPCNICEAADEAFRQHHAHAPRRQ